MAVTLKTISERVGISQAAVSMILNRRANDLSSPATRKKVFDIARELNYKQKFGHKVLRGDNTRSVAILYAMHRLLMEEQIQQLVFLLQNKLRQHDYLSSLLPAAGNDEENLQLVQELIQRGIDHFIFIGCPCGFAEIETAITEAKRTVIGFNSLFSRNVSNHTAYAIKHTVNQFITDGRTNFRLFVGNKSQTNRIQAVCDIFPEMSFGEVCQKYIYSCDFSGEIANIDELTAMGYHSTGQAMKNDPGITALMYISDFHMLGGIRYLHENGYVIGKDVALCGCNNIHAVRNSVFPLSSWEINMEKISDILVQGCDKKFKVNQLIDPKFINVNGGTL